MANSGNSLNPYGDDYRRRMRERGAQVERETSDGHWVPAEPLPEPFGVLWGRLWHERRRHGEPKWVALFTSWRDARAIDKTARTG